MQKFRSLLKLGTSSADETARSRSASAPTAPSSASNATRSATVTPPAAVEEETTPLSLTILECVQSLFAPLSAFVKVTLNQATPSAYGANDKVVVKIAEDQFENTELLQIIFESCFPVLVKLEDLPHSIVGKRYNAPLLSLSCCEKTLTLFEKQKSLKDKLSSVLSVPSLNFKIGEFTKTLEPEQQRLLQSDTFKLKVARSLPRDDSSSANGANRALLKLRELAALRTIGLHFIKSVLPSTYIDEIIQKLEQCHKYLGRDGIVTKDEMDKLVTTIKELDSIVKQVEGSRVVVFPGTGSSIAIGNDGSMPFQTGSGAAANHSHKHFVLSEQVLVSGQAATMASSKTASKLIPFSSEKRDSYLKKFSTQLAALQESMGLLGENMHVEFYENDGVDCISFSPKNFEQRLTTNVFGITRHPIFTRIMEEYYLDLRRCRIPEISAFFQLRVHVIPTQDSFFPIMVPCKSFELLGASFEQQKTSLSKEMNAFFLNFLEKSSLGIVADTLPGEERRAGAKEKEPIMRVIKLFSLALDEKSLQSCEAKIMNALAVIIAYDRKIAIQQTLTNYLNKRYGADPEFIVRGLTPYFETQEEALTRPEKFITDLSLQKLRGALQTIMQIIDERTARLGAADKDWKAWFTVTKTALPT